MDKMKKMSILYEINMKSAFFDVYGSF